MRVSISERYPTSDWLTLMEVHMENSRHIQSFEVAQRQYAKYLRVRSAIFNVNSVLIIVQLELLSHHGHEHFCTLSLVRLLGISMVDEFEAHEMDIIPAQVRHNNV